MITNSPTVARHIGPTAILVSPAHAPRHCDADRDRLDIIETWAADMFRRSPNDTHAQDLLWCAWKLREAWGQ